MPQSPGLKMLLSPNWEESSSLWLPEALQSLQGLHPTMIPVNVVWYHLQMKAWTGWGSLHNLQ